MNGRPADSHYYTRFFSPGETRNIESLETADQVGGMQIWSTQLQGGYWHGKGKITLSNGRVFIGEFKQGRMSEGILYEMQKDNSYTLYKVKYNDDLKKDELPSE